jgi:hypothetical protein
LSAPWPKRPWGLFSELDQTGFGKIVGITVQMIGEILHGCNHCFEIIVRKILQEAEHLFVPEFQQPLALAAVELPAKSRRPQDDFFLVIRFLVPFNQMLLYKAFHIFGKRALRHTETTGKFRHLQNFILMFDDALQDLPALGGEKHSILPSQLNIIATDIDVGISGQLAYEIPIPPHPAQFHEALQPTLKVV